MTCNRHAANVALEGVVIVFGALVAYVMFRSLSDEPPDLTREDAALVFLHAPLTVFCWAYSGACAGWRARDAEVRALRDELFETRRELRKSKGRW